MARALEVNGKARQVEGKAKVVQWKAPSGKRTKICEGSISLTRRKRNSKKPSRTRVRSWKHQWLLLCLVKLWKIVGVVHPIKIKKTRLACVLEADESKRLRMGESLPNHHWRPYCWKRKQFITALQFGSQIYSHASSHKNSSSKSSGGQGMGKIGEKFRRGTWRKSEVNQKWSMKQGRRAQKFISPHWWTYVI